MFYIKALLGLVVFVSAHLINCELDPKLLSRIDLIFAKSKILTDLTFESDNQFDMLEFSYLVDLPVQTRITSAMVKNACFYLEQTKQFSGLNLQIKSDGVDSCKLHFQLAGQLRLAKIEVAGIVSGRNWYRRIYGLRYGDRFSFAHHRHAISRLVQELKSVGCLNAKVVDRVVVDPQTKLVTVRLKISPGLQHLITKVSIQFNDSVLDQGLVKKLNFLLRRSLLNQHNTQLLLNQKIRKFKQYLDEHGYPFALVKLETFKSKAGQIALSFQVDLGQKHQYQFFGNNQLSSTQLLDYLSKQGRQHWCLPLEYILHDLRDYYQQRGFTGVQVTGQKIAVGCEIKIKEGQRAQIKKINLIGINKFSVRWLIVRFFKRVLFQRYYDQQTLNRSLVGLKNWYHALGYWDFRVEQIRLVPLDLNLESNQQYLLELTVHEGEPENVNLEPKVEPVLSQPVFGKTVRRGNGQFRFCQLYRVLPYQAGMSWDKSALQVATSRLKSLDSFDHIRLIPSREIDFVGQRPVVMHLNQSHNFEMRTRLGFQKVSRNLVFKTGATYKIGSSLIYRNMHQVGDQVRLDFDFTRFYRSSVLAYQRPVFWYRPLILTTKVYDNKYDQPLVPGSKERLYNAYQSGLKTSLSYQDGTLDMGANFGFESVKIDELSQLYAAAIDFNSDLVDRRVPFLLFEPTCLIDRVDNRINPCRGTFAMVSFKSMVALNRTNSYFCKALFEQAFFHPLFEHSVIAARFRIGHIFTNKFASVMPIERFYLGGASSLRSFETDFAPPSGLIKTSKGEDLLVPQGGKSMFNFNLELRVPIYHSFGIVLFQDLGTLFKHQINSGGELLTATGVGLRYQTPVGPLRFDIGWRPRRFVADRNFAWFLTIGQAF